jgi:hypothetical protein
MSEAMRLSLQREGDFIYLTDLRANPPTTIRMDASEALGIGEELVDFGEVHDAEPCPFRKPNETESVALTRLVKQ